MNIKLNWEVESDGGWREVGEDPAAIAARQRRARQIRNAAIAVLVILAAIGGAVGYRLYQVGRQLRTDLEATISAETLALRIGDRRAFLKAQADVGEWVRIQDSAFAAYQALGDRVDVTGEIEDMDLDADKARVTLREQFDGQPYHVVWFYQHGEQGWQHIPPGAEFWGKQIREQVANVSLIYYEEDADLAEALKLRVNSWYEMACRATACTRQPGRIEIRIEPDPLAHLGWATYDESTLIIPSPRLTRFPADGSVGPELMDITAGLVAVYWSSAQFTDPPQPYSEQAWLRDELAVYLYNQFSEHVARPTFFDGSGETYGPAFVRQFITDMQFSESAPRLAATLTGTPAQDLNLYWDSYLTYRLRAEAALIADGHPTEAAILYRDPERDPQTALPDFPSETLAVPDSIEVLSVRQVGGLWWAEIRFAEVVEGHPTNIQHRAFEPFRLVDGRWVHSYAVRDDWGGALEVSEGNVTLRYFELDEPGVAGLMPFVQALYAQVEADYDLAARPPEVEVLVMPASENISGGGRPLVYPRVVGQIDSHLVQVIIPSPYASVRDGDEDVVAYVRRIAARELVEKATAYKLQPFPANHPFGVAFMRWEMERRDIDVDEAIEAFVADEGRNSAIWPTDGLGYLAFTPPYSNTDYYSAYVLVRTMVNLYGPEVVAKMLYYLPVAKSVDDWLTLTAGITFDDILDDWQNLYLRLLSE